MNFIIADECIVYPSDTHSVDHGEPHLLCLSPQTILITGVSVCLELSFLVARYFVL